MASKRKRSKSSLSQSAKKGWETRRKKNPLKWDKTIVVHKRAIEEKIELVKDVIQYAKNISAALPEIEKIEKEKKILEERLTTIKTYGMEDPPEILKDTANAMWEFIFVKDANLDSQDIKKRYDEWYKLKKQLKELLSENEFAKFMYLFGRRIGLPDDGKFSIMSFITS